MEPSPFGTDWVYEFLLLDPDDANLHIDTLPAAIAAGDVTYCTRDSEGRQNTTVRFLGFDSAEESKIPSPGDVLEENGGGAECTVVDVVKTGGDFGAGTGEGFYITKSQNGTAWNDNDQIDNQTQGVTDIATADAGTSGTYTESGNQLSNTAGLFAFANGKAYVALTAAERQTKRGDVQIKDQTDPPLWKDDGVLFRTIGDSDAEYPPDGGSGVMAVGSVSAVTDAGQFKVSDIPSGGDDHYNHKEIEVVDASGSIRDSAFIVDFDDGEKEFFLETDLIFTPQVGDEVKVYAHRRDTQPAKFAGSSSAAATAILEAVQSAGERSIPAKGSAFVFPFKLVDETDHVTPETGKAGSVTATVSKDDAAFGAAAGSVAEIGNGWYAFSASAADMNANRLVFYFTAGGCAPSDVAIITDGGV